MVSSTFVPMGHSLHVPYTARGAWQTRRSGPGRYVCELQSTIQKQSNQGCRNCVYAVRNGKRTSAVAAACF